MQSSNSILAVQLALSENYLMGGGNHLLVSHFSPRDVLHQLSVYDRSTGCLLTDQRQFCLNACDCEARLCRYL
jgi:hypothetical protein